MSRGLPASIAQSAQEAVAQTDRLYDRFHGKGRLKVAYALRSLLSCSESLILQVSESQNHEARFYRRI